VFISLTSPGGSTLQWGTERAFPWWRHLS